MKLSEIISEGYWKNKQIDQEFDRASARLGVDFTVMINGKTWKRNGEPVLFKDHAAALKAADRITATRNITTQVVPVRKKGP